MKSLLALMLIFSSVLAFAESDLKHSEANDSATYMLEIDEHKFEILYRVNADVIAMAVDQELDSFLIGLKNASGSVMVIDLAHDLIRAEDNNFAVLVNGIEVGYEVESNSDSSTLSFFVPEFSEEVEIIGTHVIPEFPFGVLTGVAVLVSALLVISKVRQPLFKL